MVAKDPLSRVFAALADPTRREILSTLAQGQASVGEVSARFEMSAAAISQHLNVLEKAGLITRTVQAQWRTLTLQPEPLESATSWVQEQRRMWNLRLDALEAHLDTMQSQQTENPDQQEQL